MNSKLISPRTNALLVGLPYATGAELDKLLEELLTGNEELEEAVETVCSKAKPADHFVYNNLVRLIVFTKNSTVFMKLREQLLQNDEALLNLYKGQYPDEEIEERLRTVLRHRASDDGDWLRRDIVEAMGEVGSEAVPAELEVLAQISV